MFRYTLRQVEYFVEAAERGSVSAAAEACHVSQTGVSLAIAQLEQSLQVQLSVRQRAKGMTLTPAGQSFLLEARQLLRQAADLERSGTALGAALSGRLAIGCYSTLAAFMVPPLICGFALPNADLDLTFTEGSSDELQEMMLAGKLDAVIVHRRHLLDGVEGHFVQERVPHVLLPADHRLASAAAIALADLRDEPMVLLDIPSVRTNLLPSIRAAGLDPLIRWRSGDFEAVRALVARGLGYSLLMQLPPSDLSYEGLPVVARPIADEVERSDVCLGHPTNQRMTKRVEALLDYCRATFPPKGQGINHSRL
ncbi:LysR family transcriptional regulator [Rhodococcus opacus]|uniref:LysR family transcriptional regulator n=1 Tax=Rhodococcus opacus TaxID=37919 RepID=A0A1B1KEY8_RHOOP|nr:LysR substrate-binding domain-containing protein [Rhodococcus opacus]ANS31157.1 LysR family transcriptional regulator [Rhodococcus opacus]